MSEQINGELLVFVEPQADDPSCLSVGAARLLSLARQLTAGEILALAPEGISADTLAEYGADQVYYFEPVWPQCWFLGSALADITAALIKKTNPAGVLLPAATWGKDACAHLIAQLKSGGSVDVTSLEVEQGKLLASKSVLGGMWETKFYVRRGVPVIAVRTAALEAEVLAAPKTPRVEKLDYQLSGPTQAVKLVENQPSTNLSTLTEANVAVCAGRGTGGDLSLVYKLAERLGGAVGATRVACEEGWIERSAQVGQSGVSIAPSLYVGLGISGDPHHVAGIRGAKTIVAVTNDSEAPILEMCDFGVVGDCQTVLRQVLEEL